LRLCAWGSGELSTGQNRANAYAKRVDFSQIFEDAYGFVADVLGLCPSISEKA
ncbi:MAG: hypothetical protein H0V76_09275, partial [Blastocatellia bacterium]|nr:hypothetical protein [Blastocatellia bacterium]